MNSSRLEPVSRARTGNPGRRHANVRAEQGPCAPSHLARNLLVDGARHRQPALRDPQDRGFRIDRVRAGTPTHNVRSTGHIHKARDEAAARQGLRCRNRQPALGEISDQLRNLLVAHDAHSPHCQLSSA